MNYNNKILVTGCAGFIGFHLCRRLLSSDIEVIGFDNLNSYYDSELKKNRLAQLLKYPKFKFYKISLENFSVMEDIFEVSNPNCVIHLAAQAGVRYSLEAPEIYIQSNLVGYFNILEVCRKNHVAHLVYASSSSVYGMNPKAPFSELDETDHPVSLYAATKKSAELLAYCYSQTHGLVCTGLRFFTVYGPWGRPDMAASLFTKAIFEDHPISVFNQGKLRRDFTYIDDIVEGIVRVLDHPPVKERHRILNIGGGSPVNLMDFIGIIEEICQKKAKIEYQPMQTGDVFLTFADTSALENLTGYKPKTILRDGLIKFVEWYRSYYKI